MRKPVSARRAWFEVKTLVAPYPALAIPAARRRHGTPFGPATQMVIEGFPRTGTTFALNAFRRAQPGAVDVACHVHAAAQVVAAVRKGVPAIVVIREPRPTALSFVIRHTHVTIRQALRGYIRFYRPLLPLSDRFVVATFDDVTTDFGKVIVRVNEQFGTDFVPFDHTDENAGAILDEIERDYRARLSGEAFERAVARPSQVRAQLRDDLAAAYSSPRLAAVRRRAEEVYRALVPASHASAG